MRRFGLLLTVAAAMLLACAGAVLAQATAPVPTQQAAEGNVVPGRYIVVLRDDIIQASSAQVAS